MEPYERSELGVVGEGLWVIDGTQPLTQLLLASKLASLLNPLLVERNTAILIKPRAFPVTPISNRSFTHAIRYTEITRRELFGGGG